MIFVLHLINYFQCFTLIDNLEHKIGVKLISRIHVRQLHTLQFVLSLCSKERMVLYCIH